MLPLLEYGLQFATRISSSIMNELSKYNIKYYIYPFTCSKLRIEILEQGVKYVQS